MEKLTDRQLTILARGAMATLLRADARPHECARARAQYDRVNDEQSRRAVVAIHRARRMAGELCPAHVGGQCNLLPGHDGPHVPVRIGKGAS